MSGFDKLEYMMYDTIWDVENVLFFIDAEMLTGTSYIPGAFRVGSAGEICMYALWPGSRDIELAESMKRFEK
jgi:hypothetical protein